MERTYERALLEHRRQHRQVPLLSGPRQVGKTTSCLNLVQDPVYYNWDNQAHRLLATRGPDATFLAQLV